MNPQRGSAKISVPVVVTFLILYLVLSGISFSLSLSRGIPAIQKIAATPDTASNDLAIRYSLEQLRIVANSYDSQSGSYGNYFSAASCNPTSPSFITYPSEGATIFNYATTTSKGVTECNITPKSYFIAMQLTTSNAGYWCIDSNNTSKAEALLPPDTAIACP